MAKLNKYRAMPLLEVVSKAEVAGQVVFLFVEGGTQFALIETELPDKGDEQNTAVRVDQLAGYVKRIIANLESGEPTEVQIQNAYEDALNARRVIGWIKDKAP